MSRARNWCFTINNYDEDNLDQLRQCIKMGARYCLFQQEKGESGTPHIQGFISFNSQKRLNSVKTLVGNRAHLIVAKGSPQQNRTYCSKESSRIQDTECEEYGEIPAGQGVNCPLKALQQAVADGNRDQESLRLLFPTVCARYPRFVIETIKDNTPLPTVPDHELYEWQQRLSSILDEPPNDREIIFVYDPDGNAGKTHFAKWYCRKHPKTSQYLEPGKKADMAYTISTEATHVFINVTRQQVEHLQYSFLESLKDGLVFSPKYESGMKYLKPMHVVVMMNQMPDMNMLSSDRYVIIKDLN